MDLLAVKKARGKKKITHFFWCIIIWDVTVSAAKKWTPATPWDHNANGWVVRIFFGGNYFNGAREFRDIRVYFAAAEMVGGHPGTAGLQGSRDKQPTVHCRNTNGIDFDFDRACRSAEPFWAPCVFEKENLQKWQKMFYKLFFSGGDEPTQVVVWWQERIRAETFCQTTLRGECQVWTYIFTPPASMRLPQCDFAVSRISIGYIAFQIGGSHGVATGFVLHIL